MAMNIGEIRFGVDAHTAPMLRALRDIQKFRTAVTRTAKSQTDGAQKAVAAMTKREIAMRRAMKTALDMQAQQRKLILDETKVKGAVTNTANALKRYIHELNSSRTSTLDFARATQTFKEKMSMAKKGIDELNAASKKNGLEKLKDQLRNLESASVLAIGPLSGLGARIRSLGAIAGRSKWQVVAFFATLAAGTVAIWKMSAAALNASKVFEASMARFKAATGSLAQGKQEMKFVMDTSINLGLRIQDTAKAYSRLTAASKGSAFAGNATRKIFLSVANAAAALRLTQGEVEGAFRAIEQIMSKGTVQAEELRGQLGERLPGAFRIAAESMGLTTIALGKLLKTGSLTAEEFLPKFAEGISQSFSQDAKSNVDSFTGSMNNLANAGLIFAKKWDEATGTSKLFILGIKAATAALNVFGEMVKPVTKLMVSGSMAFLTWQYGAIALAASMKALAATTAAFSAVGRGVVAVMTAIRTGTLAAAAATWMLNLAIMANPIGLLLTVVTKAVAAIAVFTASWFGLSWAMGDYSDEADKAADATKKAEEAMKALSDGAESQKVKKMTEDIEDLAASMKSMKDAAAWSDNAKEMELFFNAFQQHYEASKLNEDELAKRAKALGVTLGTDLAENYRKVGSAMFKLIEGNRLLDEAFKANISSADTLKDANFNLAVAQERLLAAQKGDKDVERFDAVGAKVMAFVRDLDKARNEGMITVKEYNRRIRELTDTLREQYAIDVMIEALEDSRTESQKAAAKATEASAKATERLNAAKSRLSAAKEGQAALDYYENVTVAVDNQAKTLDKANMSQGEYNAKIAEFERVAAEAYGMELALAYARKMLAAETREAAAAEERRIKALEAAQNKLAIVQARAAQSGMGPREVARFNAVDKKVMEMTQHLEKQGWKWKEIKNLVWDYQAALEEQYQLQGPLGQAAASMSNSIGNALEAIVMKTKTLGESLKDLAREMLNLALRSMFLDPMISALTGGLTNAFAGMGSGGMTAPSRSMFTLPGKAAGGPVEAGGSYLVGEKGPEILRMGGVGGDIIPNKKVGGGTQVNVTVNAPGADEGTIARIKEMIKTEMVPTILAEAANNTVEIITRPRFA